MARHRRTVLSTARARALRERLDPVVQRADRGGELAADPIAFARRYGDLRDQEVAAFYAGFLAFGRVDLFRPVLHRWFHWLDDGGGPYARTATFEVADAEPLFTLYYRWVRGPHLVLFMLAVQQVLRDHGRLEALFEGPGDLRRRMGRACDALRQAMVAHSERVGIQASSPSDLPRGLLHLVSSPGGGSACKRWHMVLRWLVRHDDGVDLGIWSAVGQHELLIPVDTHVHRISKMIGLTRRPDASWVTAEEITRNLRRLHATDPVRYDFALAHLGISGGCRGARDDGICPACPLVEVCRVGSPSAVSQPP